MGLSVKSTMTALRLVLSFVFQVVACKWEKDGDGLIYRAVVTSANAAMKKVKVQFLDFGNRLIFILFRLKLIQWDLNTDHLNTELFEVVSNGLVY